MSEKRYPPEPIRTAPACYCSMYPKLLEVAQQHGYTLLPHGSMVRDFDLVAVPWTEEATAAEKLIEDIAFIWETEASGPAAKPHGRRAWILPLAGGGPRLDISVMPRATSGLEARGAGAPVPGNPSGP